MDLVHVSVTSDGAWCTVDYVITYEVEPYNCHTV